MVSRCQANTSWKFPENVLKNRPAVYTGYALLLNDVGGCFQYILRLLLITRLQYFPVTDVINLFRV